jgi:ATP-binding cassette subfamily B protein
MVLASKFPFYNQPDQMDCGPACLKMVAEYFGKDYSIKRLRALCSMTRGGVTMLDLSEAAEKIGLRTQGIKLKPEQIHEIELPCIIHWRKNHFVVLYKIVGNKFHIADPAFSKQVLKESDFMINWLGSNDVENGVVLLVGATPKFYQLDDDKNEKKTGKESGWRFTLQYLLAYKQLLTQLALAFAVGTLLQLITPLFTQSIVDLGVRTKDLGFIQLVLIAQIVLILGSSSVDFIRAWIMLHISARMNISILTDLLVKLMNLPMSFFDTKTPGDIMQRVSDEKRIETFLTNSTLSTAFSFVSFVGLSIMLALYDIVIFGVFVLATTLYFTWISMFMKRRKQLDYNQFSNQTRNHDNIIEMIAGMHEIKLNNAETRKRWSWERVQARLFKTYISSLALTQYQQIGAVLINQGKNVVITFLAASAVINGDITLGAMMAIQFIIGQLNSPVEQFLGFIRSYQDAKISIERLNEIHNLEDEEPVDKTLVDQLPADKTINMSNITFAYPGAGNSPVLKDLTLTIPGGKTTAIVGMSGSGKTTLIKLLLRFYKPETGSIKVGDVELDDVRFKTWRSQASAVLQDGYLFTDTIANNIAVGDGEVDDARLAECVKMANLDDLTSNLHYGMSTVINAGTSVSQGQKQRILIARALYKDPEYLFLDEATNALDANNERTIVENLKAFFENRTVVVVAHRLSTVKNADNIIVLSRGEITEQGSHDELIARKGEYYNLIRNQLELGM